MTSTRRIVGVIVGIATGMLAARPGAAVEMTFTNAAPGGAAWLSPANWDPAGPPTLSTTGTVAEGCTVVVDQPDATIRQLLVSSEGAPGALELREGGELTVEGGHYTDAFYLGADRWTYGTRPLLSGLLTVAGGRMTISHSLFVGCNRDYPRGVGTVLQTGGDVICNSDDATKRFLVIDTGNTGATSVWTLSGGTLAGPASVRIGAYNRGEFIQTGGTNTFPSYCYVGGAAGSHGGIGTYRMFGGELTTEMIWIGLGNANDTCAGRFYLHGGKFVHIQKNGFPVYVGPGRLGEFIQTGGIYEGKNIEVGSREARELYGNGLYRISGGSLTMLDMVLGGLTSNLGTGVFEVVGADAGIVMRSYKQNARSTLSLVLTNGVVSPIVLNQPNATYYASFNGNLDITLTGDPNHYPARGSVVTAMTWNASYPSDGAFIKVNLAPQELIGVRVSYNADGLTLDQWTYRPKGMTILVR